MVRARLAALLLIATACGAPNVATTSSTPSPATTQSASQPRAPYDVLVRGGTIYDGHGGPGRIGDVAIRGDTIADIAYAGELREATAARTIDARGLAVAPGFVNMNNGLDRSVFADGRLESDVRQGVTLEVTGEWWSAAPLTDAMKMELVKRQSEVKYDITWTTLGEHLDALAKHGVSANVAAFVNAAGVRVHEIGFADRAPTADELSRMQSLVRAAMEEGALGLASSLIYAPAFYAKTDELVALAKAVAPYHGMYISHVRSEGNRLLEAIDELVTIARDAHVPAEIFHLKAAGKSNWPKLDAAIAKIEAARASGVRVTANMYPYTAAETGLDAAMPPWVQEGGLDAWVARLKDPKIRERVLREMRTPSDDWENLMMGAGPEGMRFSGFKNPALQPLTGKTLAEVARERGESPEDAVIDLVIEDQSRVGTIYFLMSEENVKRELALPWMSFCSDEGAYAPEGVFLKWSPHPRAYGTFARVLGNYARDEHVVSIEEAVRRLAFLPAQNLGLARRGALERGSFADVVVFDPMKIADRATYDRPHQYATGVLHVFVNGTQVVANGEHTGAMPGRVVHGPGWKEGAARSPL
jgi:N-acyl-D-amino-acid deacylase